MKKVLSFFAVLMIACVALFAEKKSVYTVSSVVGKVTYEIANGEWTDVKVGMSLDMDANVNIGLNSTLSVYSESGESFSIKPMKKGKLNELATAQKTGIKIGSKLTKSDIAVASANVTKGTLTASSRASAAKADVEWEE